jgi:eukaryotic-like serine/threonine-protein kinase
MNPAVLEPRPPAPVAAVLTRSRSFLRTQLWIWPLLAALMLGFVGIELRVRMEGAMKQQIRDNLETILLANAEALRAWSTTMAADAESLAGDSRVRELTDRLQQRVESRGASQGTLLTAPELAALRTHLNPWLARHGFQGFVVLNTNALVLASARDPIVGMPSPPGYAEHLQPCWRGECLVSQPFPSVAVLPDAEGNLRAGVPTMFAAAPIHSTDGRVTGVLGLRIAPETDFTRILATARTGASGETYTFSRQGRLLSQIRFDDELKRLGLIPDVPEAMSILTLELRDPLLDLTQGRPSPKRRADLPWTRPVAEAIAGRAGVDTTGYRDYRGVRVVGAWLWLPEFDVGLVTELDVAEAFRPLRTLRVAFWSLFGLLTLSSGLVFVLMRLAHRLQVAGHDAALRARQLGQYALDEKIGAGAFGSVYRAHHALMRRPVAVKLLEAGSTNATAAARFEREVQLTSQLTHPNTIALYDYGRTPEGVFYYAMEYLDGLTLDQLVQRHGAQPEGRVIALLRQVCGSLAEAHAVGLVHRDIKPANVFLTRRGGVPDFVKLLDFGLVKAREL